MPKAVFLFSFTRRGDNWIPDAGQTEIEFPKMENLTKLGFAKKEGRKIVFSKQFSLDEVELTLPQVKKAKEALRKGAANMIASPQRTWNTAFQEAGIDSKSAGLLAGLAVAPEPAPRAAAPADDEMSQASQTANQELDWGGDSQLVVEDDFDVDALASMLAGSGIGGRRRTRKRKGKRGTRRYRRRV